MIFLPHVEYDGVLIGASGGFSTDPVQGVIDDAGAPIVRQVSVFDETNNTHVGSVKSDAQGQFKIGGFDPNKTYTLIARDDRGPGRLYEDVIVSSVTPDVNV